MNTPPRESTDSYLLESLTLDDELFFPCLPASYPIPGDGACYEHFRKQEKAARCSAVCFGCDELREVAAAIDGDEFCAACAMALCVFAGGRAA